MAYLLRQTCQVAGTYANPLSSAVYLTTNFASPILLNSCIVICQGVAGPAHGTNDVKVGPTLVPNGAPVHPTGGGQDVGIDDGVNNASLDTLWWYVTATEAGSTQIQAQVTDTGTNYGAVWAGEYTSFDLTDYGFYNGIDSSDSWGATTGTTATLNRAAGQTCNYTPELSVWAVMTKAGSTFSAPNYLDEGQVTDGTNIAMAVQDYYFNAVGQYTADWTINASTMWWGVNLTFKTTTFPFASGLVVARRTLMGLGL